jgi:hypothetical protein
VTKHAPACDFTVPYQKVANLRGFEKKVSAAPTAQNSPELKIYLKKWCKIMAIYKCCSNVFVIVNSFWTVLN